MAIYNMFVGVAVIIAQFPINQFRSIAWYNVAVGLGVIVVQILIFRGESSCEKMTRCPSRKKTQGQKPRQIPQTLKLSRFASVFVSITTKNSHSDCRWEVN